MRILVGTILVGVALINAPFTQPSVPATTASNIEFAEFVHEPDPPWAHCGMSLECMR